MGRNFRPCHCWALGHIHKLSHSLLYLLFLFYHPPLYCDLSSWDHHWVLRLGGKCLYLLSCPVSPHFCFVVLFWSRVSWKPRQASAHSVPLKLLILLPPVSQDWDYRCPLPHPAYVVVGMKPRILLTLGKLSAKSCPQPLPGLFLLGDSEVLGLGEDKHNLLGDRHVSCLLFFQKFCDLIWRT